MAILLFPSCDALRVALAGGLVPPAVARTSARAGLDCTGHVWLEPDELPSREILTALGRLGVRLSGIADVALTPIACWAELLPLRRTVRPQLSGPVLFTVPNRALASFMRRLRIHNRESPLAVRFLPDPHADRAWVIALEPPVSVLLWVQEGDTAARAYCEQEPGIWVANGWEHPAAGLLVAPTHGVILLDPPREVRAFPFPTPTPIIEDYPLRTAPVALAATAPTKQVDVRLRLVTADGGRNETLWIFGPDEITAFETFCREAPEQLLRCFEVANVRSGIAELVVVRRISETPVNLSIATRRFQRDPRLPGLYVPVGRALQPTLRPHVLTNILGLRDGQLVWVEPADNGIAVHAVNLRAFRSLVAQFNYVSTPPAPLVVERSLNPPFSLARVAVQHQPTADHVLSASEPAKLGKEPPSGVTPEHGWMGRPIARLMRWLRKCTPFSARHPSTATSTNHPARGKEIRPRVSAPTKADTSTERQVKSPDELLHGRDRMALRQELETRLLADFSQLDSVGRAARWAELAGIYAAGGSWSDAATCWANAIWEQSHPPETWLDQWMLAECRAAGRSGYGDNLDRWLSEPGRPGIGRVVAALVTRLALSPSPPPELVTAFPRVLAILDQQFDDIPVRASWIVRLAIAKTCAGDILGLARWRDRLLRRLHDGGPALDLDEPSFLRFRGTASAERFQAARDWLTRMREPIRAWVSRHGGTGRLQWAGLDGETVATPEYAQLLLAWGLGALGERTRARDWAARARKALGRISGPGVDPAAHALLGDLFLHRIKEAHEGTSPKPGMPSELQQRLEKLPEFARYSVDRLREYSRVLEPRARVRATRGLELKRFWGTDQLGERLSIFGISNPAELNDEARALLALTTANPTTATLSRVVFALLDAAPFLDREVLDAALGLLHAALDSLDVWLHALGMREENRKARTVTLQAEMISAACAAVSTAETAERLLRELTRSVIAGPLLPAVLAVAPRVFQAARTFGLVAAAEALAQALDPTHGTATADSITPQQVGVAVGWFVAGNEEAGGRLLDTAREALYLGSLKDPSAQGLLALAYAEALGFAPVRLALGRLEELFQRLDRFSVDSSTNRYYTLFSLRFVDTVVRSVVTDEFTLSPAVRTWLDEDEFLIRLRLHRDMTAILRDNDLQR